jgi:hypothetical protein
MVTLLNQNNNGLSQRSNLKANHKLWMISESAFLFLPWFSQDPADCRLQ